jgi:hypothetical protein
MTQKKADTGLDFETLRWGMERRDPDLVLERVMNSIRNGIGMRETEIARKLS